MHSQYGSTSVSLPVHSHQTRSPPATAPSPAGELAGSIEGRSNVFARESAYIPLSGPGADESETSTAVLSSNVVPNQHVAVHLCVFVGMSVWDLRLHIRSPAPSSRDRRQAGPSVCMCDVWHFSEQCVLPQH